MGLFSSPFTNFHFVALLAVFRSLLETTVCGACGSGRGIAPPLQMLFESRGVKWRATYARSRVAIAGEKRAELTCSEIIEGVETLVKFGIRQAAFAVQPAELILCRALSFLAVALLARGNQVAIRIAPFPRSWHHVVEAPHAIRDSLQAVKTHPALARMDRPA